MQKLLRKIPNTLQGATSQETVYLQHYLFYFLVLLFLHFFLLWILYGSLSPVIVLNITFSFLVLHHLSAFINVILLIFLAISYIVCQHLFSVVDENLKLIFTLYVLWHVFKMFVSRVCKRFRLYCNYTETFFNMKPRENTHTHTHTYTHTHTHTYTHTHIYIYIVNERWILKGIREIKS